MWETPLTFPELANFHSFLDQTGLRGTMILHQWQLTLAAACMFIFVSSQSFLEKRKCVFKANSWKKRYRDAGNVTGSVQLCKNTQCCVGYYLIINGQPKIDTLACDAVERFCPDGTCIAQARFNGRAMKCVCNTDLCNNNITLISEIEEPQLTDSYSGDDWLKSASVSVGALLLTCLMIFAVIRMYKEKKNHRLSSEDNTVSQLCTCQATTTCEIDVAHIELEQIVGCGNFATVWQGKYQGSTVAVKVFPGPLKHRFTAEKEVHELPLMRHAGIVPFLGVGRKQDDGSCLIVLQFAECGTLHSFLCENTLAWMSSLKLCRSLSEGLSYLHSDLRTHDVHKPPVAHRDLSSSNVLVRADGTCVLCDFGCSSIVYSCSKNPLRQRHMEGQVRLGTQRYMSPEILEGSVNLRNSWCFLQGDIYALALLLWEIWMRCSDLFEDGAVPKCLLPYEYELGAKINMETLIHHVCHMGERPFIPQHWEQLPQGFDLLEILTDCWDEEPDARLTSPCVANRIMSLKTCYSA